MSEHFVKFIDNRKAIEDRVLGAVTRYFLAMDTRTDEVTGEGLQKIHVGASASEDIAHVYRATMQHVESYFNEEMSRGTWSDFQCTLVLSIFNDYVKKQSVRKRTMYYKINAGPLAVDNGAVAPLNKLFQIASAAGTKVLTGNHYGDDYIAVPTNQSDKEAIEELLAEEKLPYKVVDKLPYYIVE